MKFSGWAKDQPPEEIERKNPSGHIFGHKPNVEEAQPWGMQSTVPPPAHESSVPKIPLVAAGQTPRNTPPALSGAGSLAEWAQHREDAGDDQRDEELVSDPMNPPCQRKPAGNFKVTIRPDGKIELNREPANDDEVAAVDRAIAKVQRERTRASASRNLRGPMRMLASPVVEEEEDEDECEWEF